MKLVSKLMIGLAILLSANLSAASTEATETQEALKIYRELSKQSEVAGQPFMQVLSRYVKANLTAGRCDGSWDCSWPATQCVNNRCVKPDGDFAECSGSWDCSWPTNQCVNGRCVKPNGDAGECSGSWDCSWPYTQCVAGSCEKP